MKIDRFWAKGYRSLVDVELKDLGPFNVFYGPNGSGKSNVLDAIRTLHRLVAFILAPRQGFAGHTWVPGCGYDRDRASALGPIALREGLVRGSDPTTFLSEVSMQLGAEWSIGTTHGFAEALRITRFRLAVYFTSELLQLGSSLGFSSFEVDRGDGWEPVRFKEGDDSSNEPTLLGRTIGMLVRHFAYDVVDAIRSVAQAATGAAQSGTEDPIRASLERGEVKEALFLAYTSPDHERRQRLHQLREMLKGPPLNRPPFEPVQDPVTRRVDVREPHPRGGDISLDMAGLGVAQVYAILGRLMLSGARAVAIEEPEAHLYERGAGLHLRELLLRAVREGYIDQLFIATHSSLFDLDDTGYFDVRLENHETKIEKRSLDEIDRHLYEPGPTLHAFEELLRISDPKRVMARRPDGTAVTTEEMLALLRAADPVALAYLEDLHRAAIDVVGLRARKKAPA